MENMGNTIVAVLAAAANAPDTPVGELGQLVSQVQQQKLLVELQGQVNTLCVYCWCWMLPAVKINPTVYVTVLEQWH